MKIETMQTLKASPRELTRGAIEAFLSESGVSTATVVDVEVSSSGGLDEEVELTVTEERPV